MSRSHGVGDAISIYYVCAACSSDYDVLFMFLFPGTWVLFVVDFATCDFETTDPHRYVAVIVRGTM